VWCGVLGPVSLAATGHAAWVWPMDGRLQGGDARCKRADAKRQERSHAAVTLQWVFGKELPTLLLEVGS
jgi:hypothetical protein